MIIVTGAPRTGTSLMMQTLVELGLKTPASKFIDAHKDIIDYNVKGFYEMNNEIDWGVPDDRYKGQALKLFPGELYHTELDLIDKVIVCKRPKKEALKTYTEIHKILNQDLTPSKIYDLCYSIIPAIVAKKPHIFINFEDINNKPKEIILSLCEFLDINPGEEKINNAIKNVDYAITNSRSSNISRDISLRDVRRK